MRGEYENDKMAEKPRLQTENGRGRVLSKCSVSLIGTTGVRKNPGS
jgi:hypothetical protein